ncbi:hypothetical protein GCM10011404_33040 [Sphingomonas prati]|nr:hypothetical protein GCM10011404_33040 [Sphingomonas prati]
MLFAVGCKPAGQLNMSSLRGRVPSASTIAAQFATMGQTAMRNRNGALAVAMAERAVSAQPGIVRYRSQLGQSYLLAGRFASAIQAFRGVVATAPSDGRTLLSMALAQAAFGQEAAARSSLMAADGLIGVPDLGLARALIGDSDGAIELLEPVARAPDAVPRTRQNLALAYALAGQWDKARAIAGQDLSADQLSARMLAWASLAKPQPARSRVSAFIGVTPAVIDPGMPVQLALSTQPF